MEGRPRLREWVVAGAVSAVALAAPANALSASIALTPAKTCYRSDPLIRGFTNGESPFLTGAGFTPNAAATVTLGRNRLGSAMSSAEGSIGGSVELRRDIRGERNQVLTATDEANPANAATLALRVTGVAVDVKPRRAGPGRRVRVKAYGFTGSRRLYAHVRRGRYRRDIRIGRLKGVCRKLSRRATIFRLGTRTGVYTVQFDGRRRYAGRTKPRIRYGVTIFRRRVNRGVMSAAAANWVRIR